MSATQEQIDKLYTLMQLHRDLVNYVNNLIPAARLALDAEIVKGKKELIDSLNEWGIKCDVSDSLTALADKMEEMLTYDSIANDCVFADDAKRPLALVYFACEGGKGIKSIHNDEVQYILSNSFRDCSTLISVNLPNVTSVGNNAFQGCTGLTEINLPNVTSVGNSAFQGCTGLTKINLPNVTSVGNNAFKDCTGLTESILPSLVDESAYGIHLENTRLKKMYAPALRNIGYHEIQNNKSIEVVNFMSVSKMNGYNFGDVYNLIDLTIGKEFNSNISFHSYYYPKYAMDKVISTLCYETDLEEYGQIFATNWDKWKWCIINHFAAYLPDNTNGVAYTIKFNNTSTLNAFDEEMIEAFTSKNWTLA